MIEARGNLWDHPADYKIITTNGDVRKDGCCVMGRGCAREAALKFPALPKELGTILVHMGNHVWMFPPYKLITFPVKYHWSEPANLDLIRTSVEELIPMLSGRCSYVMPRPGCGNGRLNWETVKPLLVGLPNHVTVIDFAR